MLRRNFVLASAASALIGANDRIRVATIGSGGRGQLLTAEFKEAGAEVAAVCDVYEPHLAAGLKAASTGAKAYTDYRRVLEDRAIDAAIIATPDHWHARMAVDAADSGKDVYLEKPLAHTIEEGARIVEAVRRNKRVAQVGTQRRSSELFQQARDIAAAGALGDVHLVNGWWLNYTRTLWTDPLEGALDWKGWLGPAPAREPDPVRFRNWYWFWDYSGGMLVGQAAHIVDLFNMVLGTNWPAAVNATAPPPNVAGAEVPETGSIAIEYPGQRLAVFTLGYKAMRYHTFSDQMNQFHGTKARLDVGREAWALLPADPKALEPAAVKQRREPGSFVPATRAHIRNFLDCVRSRKDPNATVEMGQHTNVVLCLGMQSLREGRRMQWQTGPA